jgi:hypothetical protein
MGDGSGRVRSLSGRGASPVLVLSIGVTESGCLMLTDGSSGWTILGFVKELRKDEMRWHFVKFNSASIFLGGRVFRKRNSNEIWREVVPKPRPAPPPVRHAHAKVDTMYDTYVLLSRKEIKKISGLLPKSTSRFFKFNLSNLVF